MKLKLLILLTIILISIPAKSFSSSAEDYDNILENIDFGGDGMISPIALNTKELSEQQYFWDARSDKNEETKKLPDLSGVWVFKKRTIDSFQPRLFVPIGRWDCNHRFPYELMDFEREIIISPGGKVHYDIRPYHAVTYQTYPNPTYMDEQTYENFGFKGVIDPENTTFVYTLKYLNHINDDTRVRELNYHGKFFYDHISKNKVSGIGYEIKSTNQCHGFKIDQVRIELVKIKDCCGEDGKSEIANIPAVKELNPNSQLKRKYNIPPDSFIPADQYEYDSTYGNMEEDSVGSNVAGMW